MKVVRKLYVLYDSPFSGRTHRWRIPGIAADAAFPFVPLPLPGEAAAVALVVVVIVRCVEAVSPHGGS